jgi:hypothetical protein
VGVNAVVDVSVGGSGVGVIACKGRLQARINNTNTSNGKTLFFILTSCRSRLERDCRVANATYDLKFSNKVTTFSPSAALA